MLYCLKWASASHTSDEADSSINKLSSSLSFWTTPWCQTHLEHDVSPLCTCFWWVFVELFSSYEDDHSWHKENCPPPSTTLTHTPWSSVATHFYPRRDVQLDAHDRLRSWACTLFAKRTGPIQRGELVHLITVIVSTFASRYRYFKSTWSHSALKLNWRVKWYVFYACVTLP